VAIIGNERIDVYLHFYQFMVNKDYCRRTSQGANNIERGESGKAI